MAVEGREQVDIPNSCCIFPAQALVPAVGRGAAQRRIIAAKRKFYCAAFEFAARQR